VLWLLIIYALYVGYSQELYIEDAVKRRLKHIKEEHRIAAAVELAINNEN